MTGTAPWISASPRQSRSLAIVQRFEEALRAAGPSLLFGLRLWASVSLALYLAFWLELDNPFWAGTTAALVCQPQLGASLRKGWFRMVGTMIGAVMSVVLVACFPQDRFLFLGAMAIWAAACAFAATLLHNFASYSAALAGFTVAIIAGDLYGSVGGIDANAAFLFAVTRATEISLGIVCAGVVLAGTDLGGAPRRLATQFAELSAQIISGFVHSLSIAGREITDSQPVRHEFIRRVVALDPVIDQTLGESAQIRYHSPVLQSAVDGLFSALSAWRAVANHVHAISASENRQEAAIVLENLPPELRLGSSACEPERCVNDPVALHSICEQTVRRLIALPAESPSLRLFADKSAEAIAGLANAFNGLALLIADPARSIPRRGIRRIRIPDWLPALVNAIRAFVTISVVALFWIVTAWPGGGSAITFATVIVLVLAPRAENAYAAALLFTVGIILDAILTATVAFAVLPALGIERFTALSLVLAICLVPIGAGLALARQPWQLGLFTGMAALFLPLLQPANPEIYDPQAFYNTSSAIIFGAGVAALSFRLIPPPSPAFRARRLLTLTLRDLRRLALGYSQSNWQGLVNGRLSAMPDQATPIQRAQLVAALAAGCEIIRLRHIALHLGLAPKLDAALAALAQGDSARVTAQLSQFAEALAADGPDADAVLHARSSILVLSEALTRHSVYFNAGVRV